MSEVKWNLVNNTQLQKMGLKNGNTNNPNGRPKGSTNKVTTDVRQLFQVLLEKNVKQIQLDIHELPPKERVTALLKMAEFILPKYRSIEVNSKFSDEEYQEYLAWKKNNEKFDNLSDEQLMEEVVRIRKVLDDTKWNSSMDKPPKI